MTVFSSLRGVVPPLLTPLENHDTLDVIGLERLIDHVIHAGVHGIFLLGSTGEGPGLSYRLRRELVQTSCRYINRRVPVLVGITDTSYVESIQFAEFCAQNGADAVVMAPPYYFFQTDDELTAYFQTVSQNVPLPLVLYNMPSLTKHSISLEAVAHLVKMPNIVAIKDSSGDFAYFTRLCEICLSCDFPVFIGSEEMTGEAVLLGANGVVAGGANLDPQLFVDFYHAALERDAHKMSLCKDRALLLAKTIYSTGNYGISMVKGVKCALEMMGICDSAVTLPYSKPDARDQQIAREHLIRLGFFPHQDKTILTVPQ